MIDTAVRRLVCYGLNTGLIEKTDVNYVTNRILDDLKLDSYNGDNTDYETVNLEQTLKELLDFAVERGVIEDGITSRDLFDTKLMSELTPRPSAVIEKFNALAAEDARLATDYYYKLSCDSDYIRRYRIARDVKWKAQTKYGEIDITINLSKPEKDPKAIAAAKNAPQSAYPKCQLCPENEGYAGRMNHPARANHRIIPIEINGEPWGFQYSPYVYYNEHCIVLNQKHTPMKIDDAVFPKLLSFVKQFPHYFVGSNADLPIVGGSILSHEHFQGGHYDFAMALAPIETPLSFKGFEHINAGIVKWPMSVIRLSGRDEQALCALASKILAKWRAYTDEQAFIFAETNSEPHNTITPIARMKNGDFELDLVLRNNITTEQRPMGLYHPRPELHHIKKENIGLIEVMGLAVLPARLKNEMDILADYIVNGKDIRSNADIEKHADWAQELVGRHPELNADSVSDILKLEIGEVFAQVLEDAGVYKDTPEGRQAFLRFIDFVG